MSVRSIMLLAGIVLAGLFFGVSAVSAGGPCEKGFNYAEPQRGVLRESIVRPLKWMLGLGSKEYPVGTEVEIFGETWDGRYVVFAAPCGDRSTDAQGVIKLAVDCPTCGQSDQPIPAPIPVPSSTPTTQLPTETPDPSATPQPSATNTVAATLVVAPTVVAKHASPTPDPMPTVVAASYAAVSTRGRLARLLDYLPLGKIALGMMGMAVLAISWLALQNRRTSMETIVESVVEKHQREEQRVEQRGTWLERTDLFERRVSTFFSSIGKRGLPVSIYQPEGLTTFSSLGGLSILKEWARQLQYARRSEIALFFGVTGAGKSITAEAIAQSWSVPLIDFKLARLMSDRVGRSQEILLWILDQLRVLFPGAVVRWDEAADELSAIESTADLDGAVRYSLYAEMKTRMVQRDLPCGLWVVTTSAPEMLPVEFLGRMDTLWHFSSLDQTVAKEVLNVLLDGRSVQLRSANASLGTAEEMILEAAEGLTPRQLEQVVRSFDGREKIPFSDLIGRLVDLEAAKLNKLVAWERFKRDPRYRCAHGRSHL